MPEDIKDIPTAYTILNKLVRGKKDILASERRQLNKLKRLTRKAESLDNKIGETKKQREALELKYQPELGK